MVGVGDLIGALVTGRQGKLREQFLHANRKAVS